MKIYALMILFLFLLSISVLSVTDEQLQNPVFWYALDGDNGLSDVSGNQASLTNHGANYHSASNSYILNSEENDFLETDTIALNSSEISVGCWLSTNETGGIIPFDYREAGTDGTQSYIDSGGEIVRINTDAQTGSLNLANNSWLSFIYTYNSNRLSVYVNDVIDINSSTTEGNVDVNAVVHLGAVYTENSLWYGGYMKNCFMYDRELSHEEVSYIYSQGKNYNPYQSESLSCLDTISSDNDYTLTQDLNIISGTCLRFENVENAVMDCNGYSVNMNGTSTGFYLHNSSDIEIKNCIFNNISIGIYAVNTNNTGIHDNVFQYIEDSAINVRPNYNSDNYGLYIRDNLIQHGDSSYAIVVQTEDLSTGGGSYHNILIQDNNITELSSSVSLAQLYGSTADGSYNGASNITIDNNRITGCYSNNDKNVFDITEISDTFYFTNNYFDNNQSFNRGLNIATVEDAYISDNQFYDTANDRAVFLNGVHSGTIYNNQIDDCFEGIMPYYSSVDIIENTINATGSDGLFLCGQGGSISNIINNSVSAVDSAMKIVSSGGCGNVENFTIIDNDFFSSGIGLHESTSTDFTNAVITNNNIFWNDKDVSFLSSVDIEGNYYSYTGEGSHYDNNTCKTQPYSENNLTDYTSYCVYDGWYSANLVDPILTITNPVNESAYPYLPIELSCYDLNIDYLQYIIDNGTEVSNAINSTDNSGTITIDALEILGSGDYSLDILCSDGAYLESEHYEFSIDSDIPFITIIQSETDPLVDDIVYFEVNCADNTAVSNITISSNSSGALVPVFAFEGDSLIYNTTAVEGYILTRFVCYDEFGNYALDDKFYAGSYLPDTRIPNPLLRIAIIVLFILGIAGVIITFAMDIFTEIKDIRTHKHFKIGKVLGDIIAVIIGTIVISGLAIYLANYIMEGFII